MHCRVEAEGLCILVVKVKAGCPMYRRVKATDIEGGDIRALRCTNASEIAGFFRSFGDTETFKFTEILYDTD